MLVNDNPNRTPWTDINPSLGYALVRRIVIGRGVAADRAQFQLLAREAPPLLYGRPRALLGLAGLAEAHGHRAYLPVAVLCSGDNLHADDRARIEHAFGARVYNGYASREGGLIALQCSHHTGLHVIESRCQVRVLHPVDGRARAIGTGEAVVLNAENWALPLVRYRTGDTIELEACSCRCSGAHLASVAGRESTYFMLGKRQINPSTLLPLFESLPVAQFQVVQPEPDRFIVRWVPRDGSGDRSREIANWFRLRGGHAEVIRMERIGEPGEKVQRFVRET